MFTSNSDNWATPREFFDALDREFHFTLDACALPENAKCERYFTPDVDGLQQDWGGQRYFATRRMGVQSVNGCERLIKRAANATPWLSCYCPREPIRHGFMIGFITAPKYVLFVGG